MPIVSCVAHGSFYMLFPLVYVLKFFLFFFYVELVFAPSCIIGFLFVGFMSILCDFSFFKKKRPCHTNGSASWIHLGILLLFGVGIAMLPVKYIIS